MLQNSQTVAYNFCRLDFVRMPSDLSVIVANFEVFSSYSNVAVRY